MELATATTTSGSSLSSMSSSSSSSLNLFMFEDESNMNNTPTKKHCQHYEERFFLVGESDEGEHHFLESCFLCQKPISIWHEIFMYRGDEAFCSEKCRTEQMEMDEALETVERRQRLMNKSHVSYKVGNYLVRNSYEEEQENNKSMFCIQKRPTIANLTACGLTSLQNAGFSTNATFMEP
ncbi:uncharacterized protein LOC144557353 [Carex rostrata]